MPPMHIGLGPSHPSRPPMHIGGSQIVPGKRKDLVSQVRPSAAATRAMVRPGGAAAQRRLNYQQAMAKLQSTDYATKTGQKKQDVSYMDSFSPKKSPKDFFPATPTPTPDPSEFPSIAESGGKKVSKPKKVAVKESHSKGRGKDKKTALAAQEMQDFGDNDVVTSKKGSKDLDWGAGANGWPAFEDNKGSDPFAVDGDGFFAKDAFGAGGSGFGSNKSSNSDPFNNSKSPRKVKDEKRFAEIKVTRDDGTKLKKEKDNAWASDKTTKKEREKTKSRGKSRRASLSM